MQTNNLLDAVAVTAELCGKTFSDGAARVFLADLAGFDENLILGALQRCRREINGVLTVQDVLSRIDDGRPGPEQAWAMIPQSENQSVVWTEEMANAFGVARGLLDSGEKVAARMAFKEVYIKLVSDARDGKTKVSWTPSLGHDRHGREAVLSEAVNLGRLSYEHALEIIPSLPAPIGNKVIGNSKPALTLLELSKLADKKFNANVAILP